MGFLLNVHLVSFVVFLASVVVTLLSVGGPHWYRTPTTYGGLWTECVTHPGHSPGQSEQCRRLTANETTGEWKATSGLMIVSLFGAGFAGVVIMMIGYDITRHALSMRDVQLRRCTVVASTLLNLITGLLILVATLIFPFWSLKGEDGKHVERDWAYDLGILGGALFIATGFLQGTIMIKVTRMTVRYEML